MNEFRVFAAICRCLGGFKKILIERARDCLKAGLESEDEEVKKQAEEIENEIQEKEKSDEKIRKRLRRG